VARTASPWASARHLQQVGRGGQPCCALFPSRRASRAGDVRVPVTPRRWGHVLEKPVHERGGAPPRVVPRRPPQRSMPRRASSGDLIWPPGGTFSRPRRPSSRHIVPPCDRPYRKHLGVGYRAGFANRMSLLRGRRLGWSTSSCVADDQIGAYQSGRAEMTNLAVAIWICADCGFIRARSVAPELFE
jgi:hypothetical protein